METRKLLATIHLSYLLFSQAVFVFPQLKENLPLENPFNFMEIRAVGFSTSTTAIIGFSVIPQIIEIQELS